MKRYLFEYQMRGETYGLVIEAESEADAHDRLNAIYRDGFRYKGEIAATVPAELGPIAKAWVWVANAVKAF